MMASSTAPQWRQAGRHFGRQNLLFAGTSLVALLLVASQFRGARGEEAHFVSESNDWSLIESVVQQDELGGSPGLRFLRGYFGKWGILNECKECEEQYGVLPCSVSLGGNTALLVAYGYLMLKAAQLLSDGGELLLPVASPALVGGLILPILAAFSDAVLITVSGLGASEAEAQEQVLVGMGLVAGSSVMLLTALWGSCLVVGRCDLVPHPRTGQLVAVDKQLTKRCRSSLTGTGVTSDKQTQWASWIMIATILPYLVAQTPRLLGLKTGGRAFIAVAAVIAGLGLIGYIAYQLMSPWVQKRRIIFAQHRYRRNHALHRASRFAEQNWGSLFKPNGEADEDVLRMLFKHFDTEADDHLTEKELKGLLLGLGFKCAHDHDIAEEEELKRWMADFDSSRDGLISISEFIEGFKRWAKISMSQKKKSPAGSPPSELHNWDQEAQIASLDLALLQEEADGEEDEEHEGVLSKGQTIAKAICYLIVGVAIASIFADPLVAAIGGVSKASGIPPFFVSFIVTPLATSSSEAVSSLIFAKRKRKKYISMSYSQIYAAVTMNNTMSLGIFLAIVYARNLMWDFSAEVAVIFFSTAIMGALAAVRTTFPLWMAFVGLALYPLSILVVVFLDYVWRWH